MNKLIIHSVLVSTLVAVCFASPYQQCEGQNFDDLENRIKVNPCSARKCKLTKGTNTTVAFRFIPKIPVDDLINDVSAKLAGIPLPFIGVTQTSACSDIRRADTDEHAPCPLQPGVEYVYKKYFPILGIYPAVPLTVHWSLNSGKTQVICFEVPAVIVNSSKKSS